MLIRENLYRWCRPHSSSYSVPQIIVGRLSLGVGVVGASVIAPLYITELVSGRPQALPRYQVRLSLRNSKSSSLVLAPSSFAFDQVVASSIGAGMQNVECGWLMHFSLGILLSVIQLCLIHSLPESPRVMILRGREDIARQTYQRICSKALEEIIDLKSKITVNYVKATAQMQRSMSSWKRTKKVWTHGPYRRAYRV